MAVIIGATPLNRRLTQLFSDNKKTCEALVQLRQAGPELNHLNLKLRIQKDRLVAWGLQWSDRSAAARDGDIDGSLDRAGLSDLVASIMSSIRELLDEAESLQPGMRRITPSAASGKAALLAPAAIVPGEMSEGGRKRLEEIIKDLTTSIDTLCDLSRPRGEGSPAQEPPSSPSKHPKVEAMKAPAIRPLSMDAGSNRNSSPARRDDLTDMTYIDPSMLRLRAAHARTTSSPPSYESVAAGSENRVLAYFSLPSAQSKGESSTSSDPSEIAVLLDYRQHIPSSSKSMPRPDGARFEELLLALLKFSSWKANSYTGILKLNGWTVDRQKTRFAYIYEVPRPIGTEEGQVSELQPRSLLSFLQNGSDADASNVPCLENRFRLALNISLSLMRLHEMNVTHRNVKSSNVLFFIEPARQNQTDRIWKGPLIRKPYLTGLHQLASTIGTYDKDPSSGIHYHPRLGGDTPAQYELVHDYYSLGLILLEIGLWMPIGKFWKSKYTIDDFKARLQDIYLKKLSGKCGDTYMRAVLFCMTAAETVDSASEASVGSEEEQQAGRFQQNVIRSLERCCLMDGDLKPDEIIEPFAEEPIVEQTYMSLESSISQDLQAPQDASIEPTHTGEVDSAIAIATAPAQKIKVWSHEIPQLYSQYWTSTIFPKLEKILRKALSRWESYTIDLFMAGEHPDTARPTIYVECASTAKVRKILQHLNKELRLFEIKVVPGQISRSKANNKKRKAKRAQHGGESSIDGDIIENLNPCYQQKPGFGASIGAYLNGNHLPPVSFGGAILVDGEPYGMSVHHMLEDEEEMQAALGDSVELHRSMAPRQPLDSQALLSISNLQEQASSLYPFEVSSPAPKTDDASSVGYTCSDASESDCSPLPMLEAVYPFELDGEDDTAFYSDLDESDVDDEFWLRHDFDETSPVPDYEEYCDLGDTIGIEPGNGDAMLVTQPAIDDVKDGFFPCDEDRASEHASSHTLGYIHASSGLRRAEYDTKIHEVDWALIKIHGPRLPCQMSLNQPPPSPTGFLCPRPAQILPSESLGCRAVHSHTRTSGLFAKGTILPNMQLVRMPGRISPSHSWQVKGNFGPGGDSGAWVFDDATGAVCGHVLAWSERSGTAYIAPMDIMVRDIERVLGKKVRLPGVEAAAEEEEVRGVVVAGRLNVPSLADETCVKASSPVVPTSPPVLPRYDSGRGERTIEAKIGRADPSTHGIGVQAG